MQVLTYISLCKNNEFKLVILKNKVDDKLTIQ